MIKVHKCFDKIKKSNVAILPVSNGYCMLGKLLVEFLNESIINFFSLIYTERCEKKKFFFLNKNISHRITIALYSSFRSRTKLNQLNRHSHHQSHECAVVRQKPVHLHRVEKYRILIKYTLKILCSHSSRFRPVYDIQSETEQLLN